MKHVLLLVALSTLGACATVTDQRSGSITVDGRTYSTVTRDYVTGEGPSARQYTTTTIRLGAGFVTCDPNGRLSCQSAVRLERSNREAL